MSPTDRRAPGRAEVTYVVRDGAIRLQRLYQEGCAKARLPRSGATPEVVLINTAGGVTGGDRIDWRLEAGPGAALVATSQAAERVYRPPAASPGSRRTLVAGAGARLDWLPQETIVFEAGRIERSLDAEVADDARLLALEMLVLGRAASGETVTAGSRRPLAALAWRPAGACRGTQDRRRRGARDGDAGGGRAMATLVAVEPDAALRLDAARRALEGLGG